MTNLSLKEIGNIFGRDHATVLSSIGKIDTSVKTKNRSASEIKKINVETDRLLSKLKLVQKSLSGINQEVDDLQSGFSNVLDTLTSTKTKDEQAPAKETSWRQLFLEGFSKELKKEITDVYQESVKKYLSYLGSRPILNLASAGIESLFGNEAAGSALTFMLEPILSSAALPIAGAAFTAKYSWEMAKETADLTEKIDELGEEEGRKAAGTDFWDKAALYQYDTQKADFDVLYAGLYGKKQDAEAIDEDWLSSMFSEEKLQEVTERFQKWFEESVVPWFTAEKWSELIGNIKTAVEEKRSEFTTWFNETAFGKWINETVLPWFTVEKWLELISNIKTAVEEKWNEFTIWFNETAFGKWIKEEVLPWFTKEKWLELVGNIKLAAEELWESFITWFNNTAFGKWINEKVIPFFDEENWKELLEGVEKALIETFTKGVNGAVAVLNNFINWVNEKLRIEWDALYFKGEKIFDEGSFQLFTIPNIPQFSVGGFPEDGLFMANHGELVGKFTDGRTVVANNEQIVSGIKLGVKEAVSEVLAPYLADIVQNTRETADKEFSTYIGDKEIARASERGRLAMGIQLIK